jgi:hypothetical protein
VAEEEAAAEWPEEEAEGRLQRLPGLEQLRQDSLTAEARQAGLRASSIRDLLGVCQSPPSRGPSSEGTRTVIMLRMVQ